MTDHDELVEAVVEAMRDNVEFGDSLMFSSLENPQAIARAALAVATPVIEAAFLERLIADCQFNIETCQALGETNYVPIWEGRSRWLRNYFRPIVKDEETPT